MYTYDDQYFFINENRVCFLIDAEADLASLPTTSQPGDPTQAGGSNVTTDPINAGSLAYSIASSKKYILNSKDEWIEFKAPGGGGGGGGGDATALSDLDDVALGTPHDGDFLVYNAASGKWINKKADQVVVSYNNATDLPTLNGHVIQGDLTSEDLDIDDPLTQEQLDALLGLI